MANLAYCRFSNTLEEQKHYCSAYYPEKEFKDLTNWIIAECIFEQELSGLY